jgi:cyclopropane fatty-acyl-phospholipid synthase-like methyltransferase
MSHSTYVEKTLAPFVPTPQIAITASLKLLQLGKEDTFVDLGCGDGRAVMDAASYGVGKSIGIDIDSRCIDMALDSLSKLSDEEKARVEVICADFTENQGEGAHALTSATAVFFYLSPDGSNKFCELLSAQPSLQPNLRVVSIDYPLNTSFLELEKQTSVMGLDLNLYTRTDVMPGNSE